MIFLTIIIIIYMSELRSQEAEGALKQSSSVAQQPKKLFKYYMDRNIEAKNQELHFFNRTQRWRYSTATKKHGMPLIIKH